MFDENESSSDDRLDFFFLNLVGQLVTVFVDDGSVLQGLFISVDDDKQHLLLSKTRFCASLLHTSDDCAMVQDKVKLAFEHVIMMEAVQVAFRGASATRGANEHLTGPGAGQMKRWTEFSDDDEGDELEAKGSKKDKPWDQFETNQKKFGVKSTYQEELYTTKLNRDEFTPAQRAEADRVAREIEGSAVTGGIQHRAERGEDVGDDEGLMYSDVARTQEPLRKAPNAYVPPSRREHSTESSPQQQQGFTPPPMAVGNDVEDRAQHISTTHPVRATAPQPLSPPSHLGSKRNSLNASANEWKPPAGAGAHSPPQAAPKPANRRAISKMLMLMADSIASTAMIKNCNPEWPGEDIYYDEETDPNGSRYGPNSYNTNLPPSQPGPGPSPGWSQHQHPHHQAPPQHNQHHQPQQHHHHQHHHHQHHHQQQAQHSSGPGFPPQQPPPMHQQHHAPPPHGQHQHHHHHHHHHHQQHQQHNPPPQSGGNYPQQGPPSHPQHQYPDRGGPGPSSGGGNFPQHNPPPSHPPQHHHNYPSNMNQQMQGHNMPPGPSGPPPPQGGGLGSRNMQGSSHQHQDPNAGSGYGNQGSNASPQGQGMPSRGGVRPKHTNQPQQPVPQHNNSGGSNPNVMAPQAIDGQGRGGGGSGAQGTHGMRGRGRGSGGAPPAASGSEEPATRDTPSRPARGMGKRGGGGGQ